MDWIFEHLQIVVIGILVIGSFLKSRLDSARQEQQERDELPDFDDRPDDSYRKMAPPAPSVPPPLVRASIPEVRTSRPPPIPQVTYTLPGAFVAAEEENARVLKHQQDLADHLRQIRETKATTTGGAAATRARVAASKNKAKPMVTAPLSLRSRLQSPSEVRRAFVLKEILDRPVGLR